MAAVANTTVFSDSQRNQLSKTKTCIDIVLLLPILFYCVAHGNDNGLSCGCLAPWQDSGCIVVSFCWWYLKALRYAEAWICSLDLQRTPSCWTRSTVIEFHALMGFLEFGDGIGETWVKCLCTLQVTTRREEDWENINKGPYLNDVRNGRGSPKSGRRKGDCMNSTRLSWLCSFS